MNEDDNFQCKKAKEWYVKELENAMKASLHNKEDHRATSFAAGKEFNDKETFENIIENSTDHCSNLASPSFPSISKQVKHLVLYDPEGDGNCLFKAVLGGLHDLNLMTNVTDPCVLRKETMQYLSENRTNNAGVFSWEELAMMQKDDVMKQIKFYLDNDVCSDEENGFEWKIPIVSLDDYIKNMIIDTPYKCCWGDSLEIRLMSMVYSVKIAVYEEQSSEVVLKECFQHGPEYPTVNILYAGEGTHYKTILTPKSNQNTPHSANTSLSSAFESELIQQLVLELRGLKLKDLKNLYLNVSESLKERNGMVADFNVLLTALMSCNTNSLFWDRESKAKAPYFILVRTSAKMVYRSLILLICSLRLRIMLESIQALQKMQLQTKDLYSMS